MSTCSSKGMDKTGKLQGYYRWHAPIYDATRWSFLFGRRTIVVLAAKQLGRNNNLRILEVGCGTGRNLKALARTFPKAQITGVDLCAPMLAKAEKSTAGYAERITLLHEAYATALLPEASCDLVLFSYALTMFNPGFDTALDTARTHLKPGGLVAVTDFHDSRLGVFKSWMGANHVRMEGHLAPELDARFERKQLSVRRAYAGVWEYFLYLGRRSAG